MLSSQVRAIAQTYLQEKYADGWDLWDIGVDVVEPAPGGWKVKIGYRDTDATEPYRPLGQLVISYDLTGVKDDEDFVLAEFVNAARRAAQRLD